MISIVCPVYRCADHLLELNSRIQLIFESENIDYELLFVNDDSPDQAWELIEQLAFSDTRVKAIRLVRNFGQHYAISAGLDHCIGERVVVMDCDLQDQPEEIPKLLKKSFEGWPVVLARRVFRKDSFFKRLGSWAYYKVLSWMTDQKFDPTVANFGVYHRMVIDALKVMPEQNRNFPLFVSWLGFPSVAVDVEHAPRSQGRSSYTLRKLFSLAFDSIFAYSNKPLRIGIKLGFYLATGALLYAAWLIYRYSYLGIEVEGWTSVMVSIYFLSGMILSMLGIVGIYVGKVFDETKQRPLYIVSKKINF